MGCHVSAGRTLCFFARHNVPLLCQNGAIVQQAFGVFILDAKLVSKVPLFSAHNVNPPDRRITHRAGAHGRRTGAHFTHNLMAAGCKHNVPVSLFASRALLKSLPSGNLDRILRRRRPRCVLKYLVGLQGWFRGFPGRWRQARPPRLLVVADLCTQPSLTTFVRISSRKNFPSTPRMVTDVTGVRQYGHALLYACNLTVHMWHTT